MESIPGYVLHKLVSVLIIMVSILGHLGKWWSTPYSVSHVDDALQCYFTLRN